MTPRVLALAALCTLGAAWTASRDERRFPHRAHARLFPTCASCHAGIPSDDPTTAFPRAESCAQCHDGRNERTVDWNGPRITPSNLRFSHRAHAERSDTAAGPLGCGTCHALPGTPAAGTPGDTAGVWMAVARARPERCLTCHAHLARDHLADDSRCATCHVPLFRAVALPDSALARFPPPPSHDEPAFLRTHGRRLPDDAARCAVCHTGESCARCHANVAALPAIAELGSDPRIAALVQGRGARYPAPESHARADFAYAHGAEARRAIGRCANCHTQPSCRACHIGSGAAREIGALPMPAAGGATGVRLRGRSADLSARSGARTGHTAPRTRELAAITDSQRVRATSVHPAGFRRTHGPSATGGQLSCRGCHLQRFCADCHDGEGRRRYHPLNFVSRHPADAYGRETDCASCHNPEAFCRSCHIGAGLGATGRLEAGFHTAQPLWLLQHGAAARQALQSCTSCHTQRDCMQCHATTTQRINPHGPGFDARRLARRSTEACVLCHLGDPLARR